VRKPSQDDLLAMDVIGWGVSPVPEPSTHAMLGAGLLLLGAALPAMAPANWHHRRKYFAKTKMTVDGSGYGL
jgi:hypothetical protein